MAKPALSPIEKRDLQLLDFLREHTVADAAAHFKMSEGCVNSWLFRLRGRVMCAEEYLRQVRHLKHISDRVTKLTSSAKIVKRRLYQEEEDDGFIGPR